LFVVLNSRKTSAINLVVLLQQGIARTAQRRNDRESTKAKTTETDTMMTVSWVGKFAYLGAMRDISGGHCQHRCTKGREQKCNYSRPHGFGKSSVEGEEYE